MLTRIYSVSLQKYSHHYNIHNYEASVATFFILLGDGNRNI